MKCTEGQQQGAGKSPMVPHCDCRELNELVRGKAYKRVTEGAVFRMLPTKATKDGYCVHCGYACLVARIEDVASNSNSNALIAVNEVDGSVLRFPSFSAARSAGFTNAHRAVYNDRLCKGYRFRFEEA